MAIKGAEKIEERQTAVRGAVGKKRRKKKRVFFYLILFILLITVVSVSSLTIFFNIKQIKVTGEVKYSNEEVIAASGLAIGTNMFRINKFTIVDKITKTLPYIKTVTIKRNLPDTLLIELTPVTPAAYIETAGGLILISGDGKAIENTTTPPKLPNLKGSGVLQNTVGEYVNFEGEGSKELFGELINDYIKHKILEKVTLIDISKRHDIIFEYEDRILVHLGNTDFLDKKVEFFNYVISKHPVTERAVVNVSDTTAKKATYDPLTVEQWNNRYANN